MTNAQIADVFDEIADVLEFQMRISIREATDLAFVPSAFHKYAEQPSTV